MTSKHLALPIRSLWSLLLCICLLSWSCEQTDNFRTIEPGSNVLEAVSRQESLSLFHTALQQSNISSTLRNQNLLFTVFAPNNQAVTDYLQTRGYSSLAEVPSDELNSLVRYHIALGRRPANMLDSALLINTLSDKNIFVYRTSAASNIFLNNEAEIVEQDLSAGNGTVHIINEVLTQPAQSLGEYVASRAGGENDEFTFLYAALQRADLLTLLNSGHPLTLLAPTDAAFMNAGYTSTEDISNEDPVVLRNILLYHLLPAYRYSFMFPNGAVETQQGGKITFNTESNTITGAGNEQPANLISEEMDILTANGLVHAIDMVLLPQPQ